MGCCTTMCILFAVLMWRFGAYDDPTPLLNQLMRWTLWLVNENPNPFGASSTTPALQSTPCAGPISCSNGVDPMVEA